MPRTYRFSALSPCARLSLDAMNNERVVRLWAGFLSEKLCVGCWLGAFGIFATADWQTLARLRLWRLWPGSVAMSCEQRRLAAECSTACAFNFQSGPCTPCGHGVWLAYQHLNVLIMPHSLARNSRECVLRLYVLRNGPKHGPSYSPSTHEFVHTSLYYYLETLFSVF